jgi:hypothetical protein
MVRLLEVWAAGHLIRLAWLLEHWGERLGDVGYRMKARNRALYRP